MADPGSSDQYPRVWDESPDSPHVLDRTPARLRVTFRNRGDELLSLMEKALSDVADRPATQCQFTRHEVAYLAYAYLQWTAVEGRQPPAALMRILQRLLRLENQNCPPPGVAAKVFVLPRTERLELYEKALDIKAAEPEISVREHARRVGVDRATLRDWMATPSWEALVRIRRGEPWEPLSGDHEGGGET